MSATDFAGIIIRFVYNGNSIQHGTVHAYLSFDRIDCRADVFAHSGDAHGTFLVGRLHLGHLELDNVSLL